MNSGGGGGLRQGGNGVVAGPDRTSHAGTRQSRRLRQRLSEDPRLLFADRSGACAEEARLRTCFQDPAARAVIRTAVSMPTAPLSRAP